MNAMETLLMMTERYERLMTDRDTSDGVSGGMSQYVSVVKFCGQPILPPVVSTKSASSILLYCFELYILSPVIVLVCSL